MGQRYTQNHRVSRTESRKHRETPLVPSTLYDKRTSSGGRASFDGIRRERATNSGVTVRIAVDRVGESTHSTSVSRMFQYSIHHPHVSKPRLSVRIVDDIIPKSPVRDGEKIHTLDGSPIESHCTPSVAAGTSVKSRVIHHVKFKYPSQRGRGRTTQIDQRGAQPYVARADAPRCDGTRCQWPTRLGRSITCRALLTSRKEVRNARISHSTEDDR